MSKSKLPTLTLVSESEAQKDVKEYFECFPGYEVLVTNNGIARAPEKREDGTRPRAFFATPGVPDLIIVADEFPPGCALLIEMKKPEIVISGKTIQKAGEMSPAQKALHSRRRIYLCHGAVEAREIHKAFLLSLSGRKA